MTGYDVVRYQIWKNGDHGSLYLDMFDAIKDAIDMKADEVECVLWISDEDYEDGKPADDFIVVWRKDG